MAHHADSCVFACSDLCELGAEEVACCSHCCVGQSCSLECLLPAASFFLAVEWLSVECEYELVLLGVVLLDLLVESYP